MILKIEKKNKDILLGVFVIERYLNKIMFIHKFIILCIFNIYSSISYNLQKNNIGIYKDCIILKKSNNLGTTNTLLNEE
jgi:hypothetical protein